VSELNHPFAMKKLSFLFVAAVILVSSGCRSYSFLDIKYSDEKTKTKIRPLEPKNSNTSFLDLGYGLIFSHEIKRNISQLSLADSLNVDKDNMGTAELRLIKSKNRKGPLLFLMCTAFGLPSLGSAGLVGLPIGHHKGVVKIAVDVKDGNGNLIKTYTARGAHDSFKTCYWGYKKDDAKDKSRDKAFQKAMNKIKAQMDADAAMLNEKLPEGLLSPEERIANKYMQESNVKFEAKNYADAIPGYETALSNLKTYRKSNAKLFFRLGYSYINQDGDSAAMNGIKYLNKALELDPKIDYLAPLGLYLAYRSLNDYESAIKWLDYTGNNFEVKKEVIKEWRDECVLDLEQTKAGAYLKTKPENVVIKNLGAEINGKEGDYFPSVTADESMLLFTSRRAGSTGGLGTDGKYDEDLWYCKKKENGDWDAPKNFGTPVNIKNNNGIASFTGDGQYVVCARCNEADGVGSCDLYGATLIGNTWNEPKNLGKVINSAEWDAQVSISADGKTLVWSSERKGGYGNEDLWISKKNEKGDWTEPKNLGPSINTKGNEYAPYIHPDGKTLYFSSNSLSPRVGGVDIFKSTLNDNGSWSTPQNVGYPINTERDDNYFVLTPSGLKGYFASNRSGGFGSTDIYEITFPQENKSKLITFVGNVLNEETKAALESNIKIEDLDSSKTVGEYVSNSATGKFVVILTPGHNYSMTVMKQGYLFYSENFNIPADNEFKEVRKEVLLQPLKEGKKIVLNNIFFETGKAELTETSHLEIEKLMELLNQNPALKVEISGHTDNVGADAANLNLSQDRAGVVVSTLVKKGIPAARLIAKGYGKTQPVALNDTDENRALNRRTEFKIISSEMK
jgi:outer membrane protein OmpA-like peptidoglycan-associated protein/tetratricopeptide (TPR) repeat protein